MRNAIFIICAVQALIFAATLISPHAPGADNMSRSMTNGFLLMIGMVLAAFLIPAVILAWARKAMKLGLVLSLIPPALLFLARGIL